MRSLNQAIKWQKFMPQMIVRTGAIPHQKQLPNLSLQNRTLKVWHPQLMSQVMPATEVTAEIIEDVDVAKNGERPGVRVTVEVGIRGRKRAGLYGGIFTIYFHLAV